MAGGVTASFDSWSKQAEAVLEDGQAGNMQDRVAIFLDHFVFTQLCDSRPTY